MILLSNFLLDELHYVRFKLNMWVTEMMGLTEYCCLYWLGSNREGLQSCGECLE